ncbi:MAG TPA: BON domain-containing protein [Chitinophagaceae bacterium]|jgi:osmotically-inducible protein OsmY|nr:BON domain-containing protein [Chitinophagaceae bacterium]
MKKIIVQFSLGMILFTGLSFQSCGNKTKDSDIQTSFNEKARADASLANVSATVNEGVITLSGQCPDATCKTNAETSAKGVKGVKSVVNNITVMAPPPPPTVDSDENIRSTARTIAQKYPGITADVQNGRVVLRGTVKSRDELQRVMMAFNEANIRGVDNQITVK